MRVTKVTYCVRLVSYNYFAKNITSNCALFSTNVHNSDYLHEADVYMAKKRSMAPIDYAEIRRLGRIAEIDIKRENIGQLRTTIIKLNTRLNELDPVEIDLTEEEIAESVDILIDAATDDNIIDMNEESNTTMNDTPINSSQTTSHVTPENLSESADMETLATYDHFDVVSTDTANDSQILSDEDVTVSNTT